MDGWMDGWISIKLWLMCCIFDVLQSEMNTSYAGVLFPVVSFYVLNCGTQVCSLFAHSLTPSDPKSQCKKTITTVRERECVSADLPLSLPPSLLFALVGMSNSLS